MPTINISGQPSQGPQGSQGGQGRPQGFYSSAFEQARSRYSDAIDMLNKRSADPLSPSAFAAVDRSIDRLEQTIRRFESWFSQSAGLDGRISSLRQGMGSREAAYSVSNSLRLGNRGQRFAEERSYGSLGTVQAELRRIELILDRQAKFASSPAAQASLDRQKQALYVAKSRIQAGLSGNSALSNKVGQSYGVVAAGLNNPVVSTALDVGLATVGAPFAANKLYAGYLAQQAPYLDFSRSLKGRRPCRWVQQR